MASHGHDPLAEEGLEGLSPLVSKLVAKCNDVCSISDEGDFPDLDRLKPSVVVIGTQGSGKTSVLETLMKSNFLPIGAGTMTRCPLVLQLHKISGEDEYVEFKDPPKQYRDISYAKDEIQTCCSNKLMSDLIVLSLFSRNVSDIDIIDLPGFTEVAAGGQPDSVSQNIVNMATAFITKPNCIILVVSPPHEDPTNSEAINISQKVDPEGERTFGVLTKVDLVDNFTDVVNVLEQRTAQFKFPWICVRNRSEQDIGNNVDMAAGLLTAHDFFAKITDSKHAPSMGSKQLTKSISKALKSRLKSTIMKLEAELNPEGTQFVGVTPGNAVPWVGLPKSSLAPVRNQMDTGTCAFQASMVTAETHYIVDGAAKDPPEPFLYKLSLSDFQAMYKQKHPNSASKRGNSGAQLWQTIRVLEDPGVYGNHVSTGQQSADRFKIKDVVMYACEEIPKVIELLDDKKALAAKYKCSKNHSHLQRHEVYRYNPNDKAINARQRERAHCVMIVGYIKSFLDELCEALDLAPDLEEKRKILLDSKLPLAYQNSYGNFWGVCGGFGFIECSSITRYYLPTL